MTLEVAIAHTSNYPDPICFEAGALVQVTGEDHEIPGWFWCRMHNGRKGWVHRSFLEGCHGYTHGVRSYSARELTVFGGERGELLERLDGWLYVRLESGEVGWLPEGCVRETAA